MQIQVKKTPHQQSISRKLKRREEGLVQSSSYSVLVLVLVCIFWFCQKVLVEALIEVLVGVSVKCKIELGLSAKKREATSTSEFQKVPAICHLTWNINDLVPPLMLT